jgi:hypothetical protein
MASCSSFALFVVRHNPCYQPASTLSDYLGGEWRNQGPNIKIYLNTGTRVWEYVIYRHTKDLYGKYHSKPLCNGKSLSSPSEYQGVHNWFPSTHSSNSRDLTPATAVAGAADGAFGAFGRAHSVHLSTTQVYRIENDPIASFFFDVHCFSLNFNVDITAWNYLHKLNISLTRRMKPCNGQHLLQYHA